MAVIEVRGLTKDYGEVLANDDLSFDVYDGEVFGYLGPNGAGKTTTIRTLMGFQSPTAGSATVLGHDVTDESELVAAKRRIGFLPANPAFDEQVTGREILDLHGEIKGESRRAELLEVFDTPLDRPIREYSTGNVQKLGIVQAFMHDPDLVVMDEPTSGLDPLMQREFNEFVDREKSEGLTVFLSSHVLSEVRRICDRVAILRDGRLLTTERIEEMLQRTGKFVRVRVAGDVDGSAFDVDGVHDVSCSTTGREKRRGVATESNGGTDSRRENTPAADVGQGGADEAEGEEQGTNADDSGQEDARIPTDTPATECTFTFTGDVNALLARLHEHTLIDLDVEEAPLESVFMRFYGEETDA